MLATASIIFLLLLGAAPAHVKGFPRPHAPDERQNPTTFVEVQAPPVTPAEPSSVDVADIGLAVATLLVTSVGFAVAVGAFFGFKAVKEYTSGVAKKAAETALREHLASDGHRQLVREEVERAVPQEARKLLEEVLPLLQNHEPQCQDSSSNLQDYPKSQSKPESEP